MTASALDALFDAAKAVRRMAYAPYSRFAVGAAVRGASGRIYAGCNVENAAYPLGLCAEAGALSLMIASGEQAIAEVLVMAASPVPVTPCGACRQRLNEFAGPDLRIHSANENAIVAHFSLGELLPHAFGPQTLQQSAKADD